MSDSIAQDHGREQRESQVNLGLSPEALAEGEIKISTYSLDELDAELPDLCDRIQRHIESLSQWFVDRRDTIEIAMLCTDALQFFNFSLHRFHCLPKLVVYTSGRGVC